MAYMITTIQDEQINVLRNQKRERERERERKSERINFSYRLSLRILADLPSWCDMKKVWFDFSYSKKNINGE